jgi:hypothetical protein
MRNDFAVPGDGGTLVRLDDRGPATALRATLLWRVSEGWSLRALAAPLSLESDFVSATPIVFEQATFAAGAPLTASYRFDSYRLTALRRFEGDGRWSFRAGATIKLRDAEIALRGPAAEATKTNRGIVPLLHGGARLQLGDRAALDFETDAAAAPQGRAIDAILRVERRASRGTWIFAGARVLDGGADNEEVNTFATFAYLVAGLRTSW